MIDLDRTSSHASYPEKTESMITYKEYLNQYFSNGDLPITKTLGLINELSNRYHSLYVPKSDLELLSQLAKDFPDFKLSLQDFNILVNNVAAWVNNHYSRQKLELLSNDEMMATGLGISAPDSPSSHSLLMTPLDPSISPAKSLSNSSVYSLFGNPMTDKKQHTPQSSFHKKEPSSSPQSHNGLASKLQKLITEKNTLLNQINEIEAKYLHQVASQKRTIDGLRSSNQFLWQRVSATLKRSGSGSGRPLSHLNSSATEPDPELLSTDMKELESNLEATIRQREEWSKELNTLQQELDTLKDRNKSEILENDKTFKLDFKLLEQKNTEFVGKLLALSQKISELNMTTQGPQPSTTTTMSSMVKSESLHYGRSHREDEGTALSAKELETLPISPQDTIDLRQDYALPGFPQPFKRPGQDISSSLFHYSGPSQGPIENDVHQVALSRPLSSSIVKPDEVTFYTPKKHLNAASLRNSSMIMLPMTSNPTVQDDSYAIDKGTTIMAELLQLYSQLENKVELRDQLLRHASNRLHDTQDGNGAMQGGTSGHSRRSTLTMSCDVATTTTTTAATATNQLMWLHRTKVKPILNSVLSLFILSCMLYGFFVYVVHVVQAPQYYPY